MRGKEKILPDKDFGHWRRFKIPLFKKDNIEINYIQVGEGEPLVLIPGFCCKLESWNFQISFFKQKMMVVALDNRGVGKSSRPNDPYTIDTFVKDIKDLLAYLDIKEQIHLCGFSSGSEIAQLFVLKYPALVKTLILLGTASYLPPIQFEQELKAIEEGFKNSNPEEIIQLTLPVMFSISFRKKLKRDKELYELYKNDMGLIAHLRDPPQYQDYVNQWNTLKGFDTRDVLHKISQPTLILVGSKDRDNLEESAVVNEKIPNSIFEILEGIGHGIIIEAPEKTNELMWNFIREHLNLKSSSY